MQDYARPLGDAVKVARNDLKLTQEQVASQTNTDPRTIMNIENYRGNPKMGTLFPLIRLLKIDARDVFTPELSHESSTKRALRVQMESCTEQEAAALMDLCHAGKLPLRVTHNDTKLNNVLLDSKTGRGVCVIDLDTVMPGLTAYDFGDAIRTGANTAEEDERDLSRVQFSLPMFEAFTRGFLKEAGQTLTAREIELLPMGAKLMTLECGMRFLADHLNGDKYFRVHREGHNLDRARTQFELVRHMEENWQNMADIVRMCAK